MFGVVGDRYPSNALHRTPATRLPVTHITHKQVTSERNSERAKALNRWNGKWAGLDYSPSSLSGDTMSYQTNNSDTHALAILGMYQGRGSGRALWHPETIVNCLRQLERWTRRALLNRRTRLQCFEGCGVQRVTDAYPNRTARLDCGHLRGIHTLTEERYKDLVDQSKGLKVTGRNARVGGYEKVEAK